MERFRHFFARLLFGKPLIMSVYEDEYGNKFGGTIHKEDGNSYVNHMPSNIKDPKYVGELKIYV